MRLANLVFGVVGMVLCSAVATEARAQDEKTQDDAADGGGESDKKEADKKDEDEPKAKKKAEEPEDTNDNEDDVRFRGGISGGGGIMYFTVGSSFGNESLLLGIGGIDGRVGVQFNDMIGLYVQPQVGIYGASGAVGGLAAGAILVDFTFFDQLFVGVGAGGGVLNNPAAAEIIARFGGYPVFGEGEGGRRKGLMLGIDFRLFIAPTGGSTLIAPSPTLNIGYEAY